MKWFQKFKTIFTKKSFHLGTVCVGTDFDMKEKIGSGSFSKVYRAIYKPNGKQVAIKITDKKCRKLGNIRIEAIAMQKMGRHKNIVKFYAYFEDDSNTYIVLEYIDGCDLHEYIVSLVEPLDEMTCIDWIIQSASVVAHAHSHGVTSRDIKPSNILMTTTCIAKLVDFGLAFICDDITVCKINTAAGSESFSAPEVYNALKEPYLAGPADVWSLGVVFYCMLTGYHPFDSKRYRGEYVDPPGVSIKTRDFLKSIFQLDPLSRPTIDKFYSLI